MPAACGSISGESGKAPAALLERVTTRPITVHHRRALPPAPFAGVSEEDDLRMAAKKPSSINTLHLLKTPTASERSPVKSWTRAELEQVFRHMVLARKVDEKAITLCKQNKCHFQIGVAGHEAVQVAAGLSLRPAYDYALPYYRDMAFVVSWGMTAKELLLNAMNKIDDPNSGGRQMPMHYGHQPLQILNQSSPTGTQFLQAVGAAMAVQYRKQDRVVYCSAGEGTTAQGTYHEALNWAAREKLPIVFLIQDNKYAISVHISEQLAGSSVAKISRHYEGLEVEEVNGLDFFESYEALSRASDRARRGDGPTVIDARVVRLQSHSISDNQAKYRPASELAEDKLQDPIRRIHEQLVAKKLFKASELDAIELEIEAHVNEATDWAELQPDPAPHSVMDHVVVQSDPGAGIVERDPSGDETYMVDAINHALIEEMERNPEVVVYGEDVAGSKGGVFTVTAGLTARFGEHRVFNSPLAEDSICGTAVGLASVGMKPVVEIQFADYIWTGMMQIRDELAMMCYKSNGTYTAPAVIRVAVGGYIGGGLYHSQNIESTFAHYPGLIVIYPSNATDAKGLLKAAIRAKDPVLFLEHKGLYRQVYAKGREGGAEDLIPIGRAKIVRTGEDATILTWGALVQKSLLAAAQLEEEGYSVEVVDLRTIAPLDVNTVIASARKTGRVLIAHEDIVFMGFGAELAALIADQAFEYLDAPIRRVGAKHVPIAHSPILEKAALPQTENVTEALRELLRY